MASRSSSSHVRARKVSVRLTDFPISEPVSDDDLIRGITVALGASGRADKTLSTYEQALRMLSGFARDLGQVLPAPSPVGVATDFHLHGRDDLTCGEEIDNFGGVLRNGSSRWVTRAVSP